MIKERNIRVKDVGQFVYQTFGDECVTAVVTGNGNRIVLTKDVANPRRISVKEAFGMFPDMIADFEREEDREI